MVSIWMDRKKRFRVKNFKFRLKGFAAPQAPLVYCHHKKIMAVEKKKCKTLHKIDIIYIRINDRIVCFRCNFYLRLFTLFYVLIRRFIYGTLIFVLCHISTFSSFSTIIYVVLYIDIWNLMAENAFFITPINQYN